MQTANMPLCRQPVRVIHRCSNLMHTMPPALWLGAMSTVTSRASHHIRSLYQGMVRDSLAAAGPSLCSITGITTLPRHSILPLHAGVWQAWLNAPCTPAANVSMFSFGTQLTGIFPTYFFMRVLLPMHCWPHTHTRAHTPFSLHVSSLPSPSESLSLRKEYISKLSRVCRSRAVESSEVSAEIL